MSATSGSLNPPAIQPVSAMAPFGAWMTMGFAGIAVLPGLVATTYWAPARSGMEGWTLIALAGQVVMLGIVVLATRTTGWSTSHYLALGRPRPMEVALGIASQAIVSLLFMALLIGFALWLGAPGPTREPYLSDSGTVAVGLLLLWGVVVAPVCEEIVFRGFVFRGLADSVLGPFGAIAATALMFALLHADGASVMWHYINGFLYGFLRWRTRSLTAPIAAHIFGNALMGAIWMTSGAA